MSRRPAIQRRGRNQNSRSSRSPSVGHWKALALGWIVLWCLCFRNTNKCVGASSSATNDWKRSHRQQGLDRRRLQTCQSQVYFTRLEPFQLVFLTKNSMNYNNINNNGNTNGTVMVTFGTMDRRTLLAVTRQHLLLAFDMDPDFSTLNLYTSVRQRDPNDMLFSRNGTTVAFGGTVSSCTNKQTTHTAMKMIILQLFLGLHGDNYVSQLQAQGWTSLHQINVLTGGGNIVAYDQDGNMVEFQENARGIVTAVNMTELLTHDDDNDKSTDTSTDTNGSDNAHSDETSTNTTTVSPTMYLAVLLVPTSLVLLLGLASFMDWAKHHHHHFKSWPTSGRSDKQLWRTSCHAAHTHRLRQLSVQGYYYDNDGEEEQEQEEQ